MQTQTGPKGLTGGRIFNGTRRGDAKGKSADDKKTLKTLSSPRRRKLRQNTFSEVQLEQAKKLTNNSGIPQHEIENARILAAGYSRLLRK